MTNYSAEIVLKSHIMSHLSLVSINGESAGKSELEASKVQG